MATKEQDTWHVEAESMVSNQLEPRGIHDQRVLASMRTVPRHLFVSERNGHDAYGDYPLSISHGQTISQPYMVAFMTQALELRGNERVLEIGTGSGYQTAILAELAREVYTIERIPEILTQAKQILRQLGYQNICFKQDDGSLGWPEYAPYDRIMVTAAAPAVPRELKEQLEDNGILVIPIGDYRSFQALVIVRRMGKSFRAEESIGCRFVPLIGKGGFEE